MIALFYLAIGHDEYCDPSSTHWRRSGEAPAPLGLLERGVEGAAAGGEVFLLDEGASFAGAEFAVHAAVFPFDGERALVADAVQLADDFLEVDAAAAGATEIPAAAMIAEIEMAGEDAGAAVEGD